MRRKYKYNNNTRTCFSVNYEVFTWKEVKYVHKYMKYKEIAIVKTWKKVFHLAKTLKCELKAFFTPHFFE